uniref:FIG00761799: membrane protein n=1 Tax=uncultured Thiotrichaceae bacterium TaxID=298394 RepID=A0A6S6UBJ9_9GAMM|nr:MAG: FIG00761799: membrane protein [uncultured Thiotrichaceae bacterium]
MNIPHRTYFFCLLGLFIFPWILLAIDPFDRQDWALENFLSVLFVLLLILTSKRFPLSRISYTLIFLFLLLHSVGAHYTYAEVPYDVWSQQWLGFSINEALGFERNHFDRAVHFLYGLLLAYPIREVFIRIADVKGFWGYFLPLDLAMSTSMLFELFEWAAVVVFGGDLGIAYLGTQGDVWDAHKDMLLASIGALITMSFTAFINHRLQRDFADEWNKSLSVKEPRPLGEDEIARMLDSAR